MISILLRLAQMDNICCTNQIISNVIEIKNGAKAKIIDSKIVLTACTFSNNHLFYGDDIGKVIGQDLKDSYEEVFKKRIHFGTI